MLKQFERIRDRLLDTKQSSYIKGIYKINIIQGHYNNNNNKKKTTKIDIARIFLMFFRE